MKVSVKLPDGSKLDYDQAVPAARVAQDISAGLASAALAARVDGHLCDLATELHEGEHEFRIITDRDEAATEILRHTAAHVLAQAVVRLYGDGVQYTIGPPLMDDFQYGFYYDFDLPERISTDDLPKIEAEMKKIVGQKLPIRRIEMPPQQAKAELSRLGQIYKCEMIDDLVRGQGAETISLYRQGDFLDMCRGPHLPHTGKVKVFKLLAVAGAYWRGDENNKMLTRVYGTAFFDKKQLSKHLERIEESRKRDHRILGRQLNLFTISDAVGPGLVLWMPKGTIIRHELENWLRRELLRRGYQLVVTPHIAKLDLYRTSGHYPYYKESQFPPILTGQDQGYLLKPMNCPHHIEIYKAEPHSYRRLPYRMAEFGQVYRWEQSGELCGTIRMRGYTCDDAHIFCTPDQVEQEIESCLELVQLVLDKLGLTDFRVRFGLRGDDPDKYVGEKANWDQAEANIRHVLEKLGIEFTEEPGEAAFYGPKIDFVVKDCLEREWQLGTIQVDYNMPERFELEYTGPDNRQHRPVMIHRAPFGAIGRLVGILIEHFAGALPLWLSPVQVATLPVSEKFNDYARKVADRLRAENIRVELDDSPEKVGAKIRRATLAKVPYMAVVGAREVEADTVAVRDRTKGDRGTMPLDAFVAGAVREIESKGQTPLGQAGV